MTENRIISRLGSNLHYWITGPENGPIIVFSHGATLDHHSFDAQITPLVEAGYRVVTWDLRGHGCSTPIGPEITVGILADDLLAIIDELGAEKVILLGHSFGGYVVQEFVRRYPKRINALIIIGCTNIARKSTAFNRMMYRIMPGMLSRMPLETFQKRTLTDLALLDSVKTYGAQAMKHISKEDFTAITMAGIAALWLDSGFGPDYVIPVPFLLTHGDSDRANGRVFPRQSPLWAARESNCRYEIIPDAGHTAQMDNPVAFNRILLDFLQNNVQ
ncbi:alpha/beta hydrolase [Sedimentibacter sp.]|uniref:alpha/beta fold hydrolase n=1 Tax=Sedimentibacter sp. TaxID=1960295 RepID=UPI0028A5BDE3|nr:alpha/beta hydrolase [Sedimentibacter sp.]